MSKVRRILAAAAVAGAIAVLPISGIANDSQLAGGVIGGISVGGGATTNGGQGNWPFGK